MTDDDWKKYWASLAGVVKIMRRGEWESVIKSAPYETGDMIPFEDIPDLFGGRIPDPLTYPQLMEAIGATVISIDFVMRVVCVDQSIAPSSYRQYSRIVRNVTT